MTNGCTMLHPFPLCLIQESLNAYKTGSSGCFQLNCEANFEQPVKWQPCQDNTFLYLNNAAILIQLLQFLYSIFLQVIQFILNTH